jgi:tRNA uridine 5-carboxymethylaminomethyl modification enzyme
LLLRQDNARYRLLEAASAVGIVSQQNIDMRKRELDFINENLHDEKIPNYENLNFGNWVYDEIKIMRHYAPYIEQERKAAERAKQHEKIKIPQWLDYDKCLAVRYESREKLKKYRPENLAQASKISGVNPADVAVLAILIKRGHH